MKHYFNEGEEYLRKDGTNFQGKTNKQYEDSAKIVVWAAAIAGLVIAAGVVQHLIFVLF